MNYEDFIESRNEVSEFGSSKTLDILGQFDWCLNWGLVSNNRNLTYDFVEKHKYDIDWDILLKWAPLEFHDIFDSNKVLV